MKINSAPYEAGEFNGAKKAFWAAHAAFLGAFIAPLVAMYGDVVAQGRVYVSSDLIMFTGGCLNGPKLCCLNGLQFEKVGSKGFG